MRKLIAGKFALLASPVAMAHEGHGLEGVAHVVVHNAWVPGAVLFFVITLRYLPRPAGQEQSRDWYTAWFKDPGPRRL